MTEDRKKRSTDLRGVGRLATGAVTGITDIVESLHQTIASLGGLLGSPKKDRTRGVTGMVYQNVRTVTELVGGGIDVLLERFGSLLGEPKSSRGREAAISALNGVLGDHLVARVNPLAIPMQFRDRGKAWSEDQVAEAMAESDGPILILVHGSSLNDLQWTRKGHDHGKALAEDFGYRPFYLHYNTGLHISQNGRSLADLLERIGASTLRDNGFVLVAHSMGGLVSRSAMHYGEEAGYGWPKGLRKLVFLGTPHHGAPLEKGGHGLDIILGSNAYSAPFSRLGKIRSSGITDLRYGNLLDEHWLGRDRFARAGDRRTPVPLPAGVECYALAATTAEDSSIVANHLIGDGLVTVRSALGHHKKVSFDLGIPASHQWLGRGMNHMDLLNHPEVYATLRGWLKT